jgi:hypothetical protein
MYRQGDILLVKVNNVALESAMRLEAEDGKLILAVGEATGHHHYVSSSDASMFAYSEEVYLQVTKPTQLKHQEHEAIALDIGIYKKIQQVEYTPERIRNVID